LQYELTKKQRGFQLILTISKIWGITRRFLVKKLHTDASGAAIVSLFNNESFKER